MVNGSRNIRVDNELVGKLEKIMEKEKERGNDTCSWKIASLILSRRIDKAGGLKD